MKIKAGNSITLLFLIKDSNGVVITNLSTALAVKFMVKVNETDADLSAKISKSLSSGIVVDNPSVGNVSVSLTSTDTAISSGSYFMALQIEWATHKQEVNIKETFDTFTDINTLNIIQDVIR